ncbi:MAG: DUF1801 domain-containing protein [Pontimonas sp.]
MTTIAEVLDSFPEKQSAALWSVHHTLEALLPHSEQDMSWGMPTFRCEGIIVTSLLGFQNHNSLFPGPEVMELMGDALAGYTVTKGTIHFDKEKAPPKSFLKAVVDARIRAINSSFPKKSGEFLELYGNGVLKARGKYKEGQMHGAWSFYRKDGTLMRQGSFRQGEQSGEWTTYDSSGSPYKTTRFG